MRNMKKPAVLFLILFLLFSTSCTSDPEVESIRIGTLKGATAIGLVELMEKNETEQSEQKYEFQIFVPIDELVAKIANSEVDIATVPANMASILYNRINGEIKVLNINTLGVLYIVSERSDIDSIEELRGKTVFLSGKGAVPDLSLQYLLSQNNISMDELTVEYKSEQTEVIAALSADTEALAILPQPFATVAQKNNPNLKINLDLTKEWESTEGGGTAITGVTIIRNQFLQENPQAAAAFLNEYEASLAYTASNLDETARLVAKFEIIDNEDIAREAIPFCNVVNITGDQLKHTFGAYLQVLYDLDPATVGGSLPADDFYFN